MSDHSPENPGKDKAITFYFGAYCTSKNVEGKG
jgi:hypothetical protein